jgi:leucyl/phenylalanyl-tRNA--protein transferase
MIPAELLLYGYRRGIFPMALDDQEIGWFSPDPRAIIPLDKFRVPHGLARALKKNPFEICIDQAFEAVIRACANREDTWISEEIIQSYCNLHRLGFAHSVEAWREKSLAGGLYGVVLGGAFFGESMFHRERDASKIALYNLVMRLRQKNFVLLDTQWLTPHLQQFGAQTIPRSEYLKRLRVALTCNCAF